MTSGGIPAPLLPTGITYRQLDYWVRRGYLNAPGRGSGTQREWPNAEIRVAGLMVRLAKGGFRVEIAHEIARKLVDGRLSVELGWGLVLHV